jgi:hypothetical protein
MEEPYNIYGGLQDNGSVRIPSNGLSGAIGRDDWRSTGGGDGQMNVVDPEDSRWLYNASQNGAIQRVDQKTGISKGIRPARAAGTGRGSQGRGMAARALPGDYVVVLEVGDKKISKRTAIRKMPGLD